MSDPSFFFKSSDKQMRMSHSSSSELSSVVNTRICCRAVSRPRRRRGCQQRFSVREADIFVKHLFLKHTLFLWRLSPLLSTRDLSWVLSIEKLHFSRLTFLLLRVADHDDDDDSQKTKHSCSRIQGFCSRTEKRGERQWTVATENFPYLWIAFSNDRNYKDYSS